MFCKKCGKEISDQSIFCRYCGEKQIEDETVNEIRQEPETNTEIDTVDVEFQKLPEKQHKSLNTKSIWKGSIIGLIIVLALVGFAYPVVSKQLAKTKSKEEMIAEYEKQIEEIKQSYSHFIMTQEEDSIYKEKIKTYDSIEKEVSNYDDITTSYEEVTSYINEIKQNNKTDMESQLNKLKKQTLLYATSTEREEIQSRQSEMETEIEQNKFQEAKKTGEELQLLIKTANEKKIGLNVRVAQTDYSKFPNIQLYLDITDSSGNVVDNINQDMFFISEKKSGENNFKTTTLVKASQLNEKESLNMNLVLDTSGSMEGEPLAAAQNVMSRFINTIQFQAGDSVKFTSFNSFIDRETDFMTDTSSLSDILYSLKAGGGTKLYDTLIYAVQDTAVRNGAKCVIAFTDGMDGSSLNTAQDVIQVAKQYGIPIYIVRIGEDFGYGEKESLIQIAEQSGGEFYSEIGFGDSVENIYYQIYRDLKQYYIVEYTAQNDYDISDNMQYEIYVRSGETGGSYTGEYTASEDVFENLHWNFLQAYIYDMNNHQYNKLNDYIESDVDTNDKNAGYLYNEMRTQVTGGFANVESENLIFAEVYDIQKKSDDMYLLYTREEYDVLYLQTYAQLKGEDTSGAWQMDRKSAQKALSILEQSYDSSDFYDDDMFAIWKVVYQHNVFQVKKSSDGKWKFYKYNEDITFYKNSEIYSADYYYY